ncbi:hypothetical protein B0H14DRAFT_2610445 [Mycena olivaceomarginata]|nr:hypothetical protein B0H14DRAFT_2610445 [Mycena olivaceomarginata]
MWWMDYTRHRFPKFFKLDFGQEMETGTGFLDEKQRIQPSYAHLFHRGGGTDGSIITFDDPETSALTDSQAAQEVDRQELQVTTLLRGEMFQPPRNCCTFSLCLFPSQGNVVEPEAEMLDFSIPRNIQTLRLVCATPYYQPDSGFNASSLETPSRKTGPFFPKPRLSVLICFVFWMVVVGECGYDFADRSARPPICAMWAACFRASRRTLPRLFDSLARLLGARRWEGVFNDFGFSPRWVTRCTASG